MTKIAYLISKEEGFWIRGSLPQRRHNPGDLRHGPHCSHQGIDPNAVGIEPCDQAGWEDLERQLELDAGRGMTLRSFIGSYAPPEENDTGKYLAYICDGLGMSPETALSIALQVVYVPRPVDV